MRKIYVWSFVLLLAIYIALVFVLPPDPDVLTKYHLSAQKAELLGLTVVLPVVLIYLSALYGFVRVDSYARSIRNTKEGPGFRRVAQGLMVLAFSLPIASIVNSASSYIQVQQPQFTAEVTIFRNYLGVALTLVAILLIGHGARSLYATLRPKRKTAVGPSLYWYLGPVVVASVYTGLTTAQAVGGSGMDYLPAWLAILTLAIPYAFIWCVGLEAAVLLFYYRRQVRGVIYKLALANLAKGVLFIILTSMLIRVLSTLSGPLNRLRLTPLLLVLYVLVAIYAVGFGLVARGAKKLSQIEEA